jgi:hypothetical protein
MGGLMTQLHKKNYNRPIPAAFCASLFIFMTCSNLYAASMNLAWNANTESDLAGYRIYYGTSPGNYTSSQETGRVTSYTLSNLTEGRTYYITMSAFDTSRNESRRTTEIRGVAHNAGLIKQTVYEDAEDGETAGWTVYDKLPAGAEIENVYDSDRQSNVIELTGSGTKNGYQLISDDGSKWHNQTQKVIQWSMNYSELFVVHIDLETTAGHRYLIYRPLEYDQLGLGELVYFGLGTDSMDGQWHTFVRDLQADLNVAQPGVAILEVNGFLIRGSGMVDDISMLSNFTAGGSFSTTVEAEEMSYHANGGQSGDYWGLWSAGTMEEEVYFPTDGNYRFEIIAKADLAYSIGPEMELIVDGETRHSVFVNSTAPQSYVFNVEIPEGAHEIAIGFYNDYYDAAAWIDRNLYVDKTIIAFIVTGSFSTAVEAEEMSYHANGGQSGDSWILYMNGTMEEDVYFPADGTYRFDIIAKADLAYSIGPEMELIVDGETRGSIFVNSTTPQSYTFNVEVSEGTHEIAIGFYNDYYDASAGIDRNLYVDKIVITLPN